MGNSWHLSSYTCINVGFVTCYTRELSCAFEVCENKNKCTNRGFVIAGWVYRDAAASTGLVAQDGVTSDGQLGYGHWGGSRVSNQRWSQAGLQVHMTIYRHY